MPASRRRSHKQSEAFGVEGRIVEINITRDNEFRLLTQIGFPVQKGGGTNRTDTSRTPSDDPSHGSDAACGS